MTKAVSKLLNPIAEKLQSVMTTAVETGAVAYWAVAQNVKRKPRTKDRYAEVLSFEIMDNDPDGTGQIKEGWTLINQEVLEAARVKLLLEDCDVHRTLAAQFVGPARRWDCDQDGVDALIQVAVFGRVVYG